MMFTAAFVLSPLRGLHPAVIAEPLYLHSQIPHQHIHHVQVPVSPLWTTEQRAREIERAKLLQIKLEHNFLPDL